MKFDFWDNYQNMLDVIIWKKPFIQPIWDNKGIPLKLFCVKLSTCKVWALMSLVNNTPEINNIEIIGIRPEDISIGKIQEDSIEFEAYVNYVAYHGKELELIVKSDLSDKEILIQADKSEKNINKNDKISCFVSTNSFKLF